MKIYKELERNVQYCRKQLNNCSDVVEKALYLGNQTQKFYTIYVDGLADSKMLNDNIFRPLLLLESSKTISLETLTETCIEDIDVSYIEDFDDVFVEVLAGNTVLFLDGSEKALLISSKSFPKRGIEEPDSEVVMRGSKDAFSESLRTNTALIRRRIRDPRLKVENCQVGRRSKTDLAILYIEDLVRPDVLLQLRKKVNEIDIDGIFDSGMLEHLLEGDWASPFPRFQHTQRPDKTASGLMEGRVAIVVDNSPGVLLLPVTLSCFFQASDDYYNHWMVATFERMLRYLSALLSVLVPGLYVAVMTYRISFFPEPVRALLAKSSEQIPYPIVIEILLMEIAFELVREAGVRMPGQMGNTIGIVGGLVVGQAAVDTGLVGTVAVIVVAIGAIASFAIPNESFVSIFRLLKFIMILLGACYGLYGIVLGVLGLTIHLSGLVNYEIPYLHPMVASGTNRGEDKQDMFWRAPIGKMRRRPIFSSNKNKRRMK